MAEDMMTLGECVDRWPLCQCSCHRTQGLAETAHIVACCTGPPDFQPITPDWMHDDEDLSGKR